MAVLLNAGDHVPCIPSNDVVGSVSEVPVQTGPGFVNVGTCAAVTLIVKL